MSGGSAFLFAGEAGRSRCSFWNDVLAALDNDPNLSAFRLPDVLEMNTLFTDAGFSVNIPWGDLSDPARLAANASFANAFVGQDVNGGELFQGYYGIFR